MIWLPCKGDVTAAENLAQNKPCSSPAGGSSSYSPVYSSCEISSGGPDLFSVCWEEKGWHTAASPADSHQDPASFDVQEEETERIMCSLKKEGCGVGSTSLQTAGGWNRRSGWKSAAESNGSKGCWCWIVRKVTFIMRDHILEHVGHRLCDPHPQKHPKPNRVRPLLLHRFQLWG